MYIAIDLKSFYASVECRDRQLNPLTTLLVVADESRTEKTICLAVTPALKAYGIPGRARLFEVIQKVREVNKERLRHAPGGVFTGKSSDAEELSIHPEYELSFVIAPPRMARYIEVSSQIYDIYLNYIAPEDIHSYSIDEVFMDVTHYLTIYQMSTEDLARRMIQDVYQATQITATAGVGTNLYLTKVAMDILAKHAEPDENGVRLAFLDEQKYKETLWAHRPITDFWRVGAGYRKKLEKVGLYTMGDIARCSLGSEQDFYNPELLYQLFGVNAELLIDHAWGVEPTTMADIKAYKPESNSISSGQVLSCAYTAADARLVVHEMVDELSLDLFAKKMLTDQLTLTVGYDIKSLSTAQAGDREIKIDHYGRAVPKSAHGTANLPRQTSSTKQLTDACLTLYDQIIDPAYWVRRITLTANHVVEEGSVKDNRAYEQLSLFSMEKTIASANGNSSKESEKERKLQEAMLSVKNRYGKNAMLKGMNLQEGATARNRNEQIGGHKA
ncbi:DNA polymerase V [Lachnospiraceae bacterium XBB1006]|nr:DNA polymerase V [Lachnospiraceae bacterium XBB1006]